MKGTSVHPGQGGSGAPGTGSRSSSGLSRRLIGLVLLVAAAGCYVGIVALRLGPAGGRDTAPLTAVTSALADGDLRVAASVTSLPNPPGYPLLAAPFVAAFRSAVGAPTWCTPLARLGSPGAERDRVAARSIASGAPVCGGPTIATGAVLPPWHRSQGLLGVASWLILALGALALLRASESGTVAREAGLLAFLAFLPAASGAIVQLFHPQDIVSLGLALGGLAQAIRGRWALAGALFGAAILSKQFALLLLLPALLAAPRTRTRLVLGGSAAAVFCAGVLPFLAAAPRATLENLSGFSGGGATAGQTVLSLAGIHGAVASAVARNAPVLFALVVCVWAAGRPVAWSRAPGTVGLALMCTGSRLVFESVVFPYYLLSASVLVLLVDLAARRSPYRSVAWCAAAAFFVALHPGNRVVAALGTLILAAVVVGLGLGEVLRAQRPGPDASVPVMAG
jgi:hypothetical protein